MTSRWWRPALLIWALMNGTLMTWSGAVLAQQQDIADAAVQSQWFTGSLEAPSPALSVAGQFAVEPYLIFTVNTGAYDGQGRRHVVAQDLTQEQSDTSIKYGITDHLTFHISPTFSHVAAGGATATGVGDLPVELEYRLNQQDAKTGWPSLTVALGATLPTGDYQNLPAAPVGLGSGAVTLKQGLLLQSLFDSWDDHPMRFRLYAAAFEPVGDVTLHNISSYGTPAGFRGRATPGFAVQAGLGAGYALTQRWVLALDVLENETDGARLSGIGLPGSLGSPGHTSSPASAGLSLAPAVEYNWSSALGIIFGITFSAGGHNSASYVAPQIAFSTSF